MILDVMIIGLLGREIHRLARKIQKLKGSSLDSRLVWMLELELDPRKLIQRLLSKFFASTVVAGRVSKLGDIQAR